MSSPIPTDEFTSHHTQPGTQGLLMKMKVFAVMAVAMSAVVLAGAGGAGASAGRAVPARWRIVKTVHGTNMPQFLSVAVTSTRSAWAFAQTTGTPAVWRLRGGAWGQVPFPGRAGEQVLAAGASAADNVWAFGSLPTGSGRALRWDGTRWAVARQFSKVIGGGLVLGPGDVWVFGEPYVPGNGLGTWHYNGRSWTRFGALATASALSPASIWAVGAKTAAHWNGSCWSLASLASLLPRDTPVVPRDSHGGLRGLRQRRLGGRHGCLPEPGPRPVRAAALRRHHLAAGTADLPLWPAGPGGFRTVRAGSGFR